MNEVKKVYTALIVFVLLALILVLLAVGNKKGESMYDQFMNAYNGNENTLIYVGRPTCGYCNLLSPSLMDMKERYNFNYVYVNTDEISNSYMTEIMSYLGMEKLATPFLAIVSNGKVVDKQNGYADYDVTFKFLQNNGIIAEDAKLLLNYIGLDEYKKLLSSSEKSIIVVGQSTCIHCVNTKVTLNNIVANNDTKINYLNVSYLTKEEGAEFESTLDYFQGQWGTPVTMIVQNGKVIDMLEQAVSESEFIKFFEENGVL